MENATNLYDFKRLEPKWRRVWEESGAHRVDDDSSEPKYYCLDMFPYPSGEGLHVGHWRGYVLSDVWSRYKKLQGCNVLHPMGWDAFGLPAENDAILRGVHPKVNTARNIAHRQDQFLESVSPTELRKAWAVGVVKVLVRAEDVVVDRFDVVQIWRKQVGIEEKVDLVHQNLKAAASPPSDVNALHRDPPVELRAFQCSDWISCTVTSVIRIP